MGEVETLNLPEDKEPRPEKAGKVIDIDEFIGERVGKVRHEVELLQDLREKYRDTLERARAGLDKIDEQIKLAREEKAEELLEALTYNRPDHEELYKEAKKKFEEVDALYQKMRTRLARFEQHQEKATKREAA